MAALQANSALGRSRLTRKPLGGHLASSAASSSSSTAPHVTHHREPVTTPAVSSWSSIDIPTVSNLGLFISNLRLLDLDLLEDWPGITPHTFSSTKDAAGQGQKRRIQCAEWALYRLFCIWDPEESRNKLEPYFPPLDQVQSLNLRAALLRCLEHAKKTGVLGRDAVVRKTMLDECKGERLEEVLAAFSSAVLKKVVADNAQSGRYPALAQTIALERRGYASDRTGLHALILAHKVSLNALLRRKATAKSRYEDFAQLLGAKEKSITRRKAEIDALTSQKNNNISDDEKLTLWRTLRNNWSGNQRWMETLLYGDTGAKRDAVLAASFDRVWRRAQAGRVSELEDNSIGLLGQLDARVKAQRERLERWEKFREQLLAGSAAAEEEDQRGSGPHQRQRGIDLGFSAHENIRPGRMSPRKTCGKLEPRAPTGEYARILDSLKSELENLGKTRGPGLLALLTPENHRQNSSETALAAEDETISELSGIEEEPAPPSGNTKEPDYHSAMAPKHSDLDTSISGVASFGKGQENDQATRCQRSSTYTSERQGRAGPAPRRPLSISKSISRRSRTIASDGLTRTPSISPERLSHSRTQATSPHKSPPLPAQPNAVPEQQSLQKPPLSSTQAMADEILARVSITSPSPIKRSSRHTLSLEERTRLSMTRGPRGTDVDDDVRLSISPVKPNSASGKLAVEEDEDSLVARTRRSMAGFQAARQKAQLERRRSQRKSRKPQQSPSRGETVTRFLDEMEEEGTAEEDDEEEQEARGRGTGEAEDSRNEASLDTTLLAVELMEGDQADYEAVFMSRPKIKTSPLPSPVRGGMKYGEKSGGSQE